MVKYWQVLRSRKSKKKQIEFDAFGISKPTNERINRARPAWDFGDADPFFLVIYPIIIIIYIIGGNQ